MFQIKKLLLLSILSFSFSYTFSENYWSSTDQSEMNDLTPQIQARNYELVQLDVETLAEILDYTELFDVQNPYKYTNIQIDIPLPQGGFETFKVFNAPIMAEDLANKYPNISTYMAVSTSSSSYGRLDLTHKGFHAMVFSKEGTFFVDPYSMNSNEFYISYYKKDFYTNKDPHFCLVQDNLEDEALEHHHEELTLGTPKFGYGEELKRYRIAIAATGEYTQFHGGTVADGLAAIVTSLNRISGVYERDFSVTFTLIANNDQIIYTNPNTDPYTNNVAVEMINENPANIGNVIGSANYDIGHIFATGGSGLASQGVCGNSNNKARGVTGIAQPIGDPYDIDYVSHEIGHQFSASHTFNSTAGSCAGGNRSGANAYEPGSGTTIMAYAGICNPENTQNNSDDYFHANSFVAIYNYTNFQAANSCPVKTPTGNNLPDITTITPTNTYTIPQSTPFEMNAVAVDADNDPLTYCWEQYDQQNQSTPINAPTGNQPLFRSFSPAVNGNRVFPQWSDILNNTATLGERLPDYGRQMNFRVLVRDNRPGAGGVFIANFSANEPPSMVTVTVSNTAGPFVVNSPTSSTIWPSGNLAQVSWDVAGTNQNPINCGSVDILLSLDGGENFNFTLAENLPNNGLANVQVPEANTSQARVLVKCSNNIFFNVNNGNFDIEFDCSGIQTSIDLLSAPTSQDICVGDNLELTVLAATPDLNLSYQWTFNGTPIQGATQNELVIENVNQSNSGVYACIVSNPCNQVTTDNISIQVSPLPTTPTLFFNEEEFISDFTATNQWYLNGDVIEGESSFTLTPEVAGAYSVSSVVNGCASLPSAEINYSPTSINSLENIANINVYPNPSRGVFTISITNWKKPIDIAVIDVIGKVILQKTHQNPTTKIELLNQPKGVYFIKIQSNGYNAVKKIVIN